MHVSLLSLPKSRAEVVWIEYCTETQKTACKTDPGRARQISLATAGAIFSEPGAHHLVLLCTSTPNADGGGGVKDTETFPEVLYVMVRIQMSVSWMAKVA